MGEDRYRHAPVPTCSVALGYRAQLRDEFRVVVFVGCVVPCITRRPDSRSAVENVDLDPGVICDRRKPGFGRDDSGLGKSIIDESGVRLVQDESRSDVVQRDQIDIG